MTASCKMFPTSGNNFVITMDPNEGEFKHGRKQTRKCVCEYANASRSCHPSLDAIGDYVGPHECHCIKHMSTSYGFFFVLSVTLNICPFESKTQVSEAPYFIIAWREDSYTMLRRNTRSWVMSLVTWLAL